MRELTRETLDWQATLSVGQLLQRKVQIRRNVRGGLVLRARYGVWFAGN